MFKRGLTSICTSMKAYNIWRFKAGLAIIDYLALQFYPCSQTDQKATTLDCTKTLPSLDN